MSCRQGADPFISRVLKKASSGLNFLLDRTAAWPCAVVFLRSEAL